MLNKTSCKDCVFAKYEDITQYGCMCDRLDVLRKNQIDVIECFDAEKEFFALDTFCLYHRSKEWLEKSNVSAETASKYLQDTTKLKYAALIVGNGNLEQVEKTVDSLLENAIPPQQIIVLNKYENPILTDSLSLMFELKNIHWTVQNPTEKIETTESIDLAVHKLKHPAYFVIPAGVMCGYNDITKINDRLNLGNFVFSIIEYENNKQLVNYKIHKNLNGNRFESSLKTKILREQDEKEWPQTIYQFNRLEEIEH